MPDLDSRLAGLRDELRDGVEVPDIATVADRHRQRRFRRRTQIGAVVAVLVVSAVVPILRGMQQPEPAPPATPPPTVSTEEDYPFLYTVKFADPDHGFALRADCEDFVESAPPPPCALTLFATENGEDWALVGPVPTRKDAKTSAGNLVVLGRDELVVDWPYSSPPRRTYSDDGGHTWQDMTVPGEVTDEVPAIPAGAELMPPCPRADPGGACAETDLTVLLPGSGTSARLATGPNLADQFLGTVPTADGHWWVAGRRPGAGKWSLAVSPDDGRTWSTTELDWRGTPTMWSVVSQGDTLYAGAIRATGSPDDGLQGIFRSDDDGRTWTLAWQPTAKQQLPWYAGSLIAADDGTVTANEFGPTGGAYTSTDGGHTLVKVDSARIGEVAWTRGGYLALAGDEYEFSTNGVDWRRVEIPRE